MNQNLSIDPAKFNSLVWTGINFPTCEMTDEPIPMTRRRYLPQGTGFFRKVGNRHGPAGRSHSAVSKDLHFFPVLMPWIV
jgi:hypothetical protein